MKQAMRGIWTPWAEITCFECHGPKFPRETYDTSSERWQELLKPIDLAEGNQVTYCDNCKRDIQVQEGIAVEHNLVGHLLGLGIQAQMEQTGGMNDAMSISRKNGGGYMVTYNLEGDDGFMIGKYDETEDGEWDWEEGSYVNFETFEETVKYVKELGDLKWI